VIPDQIREARCKCMFSTRVAAAAGAQVTNWSDPKKAAALEKNYATSDVQAQRDAILKLARVRPGDRCLDVGCGPGFLVEDLAKSITAAAFDESVEASGLVIGIDNSHAMLELAEQRLARTCASLSKGVEVKLASGDQEELRGIDNNSCDLVVFSQVLLYSNDLPRCIEAAWRVLKPGGRVCICETDWNSLVINTADKARFERIKAMATSTFVDGHVPPKIPGELTRVGFEIEGCMTVPMIKAGFVTPSAGPSFIQNWAFKVVQEKARTHQIDKGDVHAFVAEMKEHAERGSFFGCVHRFLFLARKPHTQTTSKSS